jgi:hypothetical protein
LELATSKKKGKKAVSAPRRGGRRGGARQRLANDDDSDVSYESDGDNNQPAPFFAQAPVLNMPLIVCAECTVPSNL